MRTQVFPRLWAAMMAAVAVSIAPASAAGQASPDHAQHEHKSGETESEEAQAQPTHDMHHMGQDESGSMPSSRQGSGTSWLPDQTPMYALHHRAGSWTLMAHGNAFLQFLSESGDRGSHQTGSINWFMGMADRSLGRGHLGLRGMMSLEPWTIRGCGYPDLLATGEVCRNEAIHDRQHPHDLFMELAATYDWPLRGDIRVQVYGGPAGEPALGPTAFPHRISAAPNPRAPITHHWFDATHIAYGVVTGGVYATRWKAEASLFNGRSPDETRTTIDLAALDSWSGRVWFLPAKRWALQVSGGKLTEGDAGHEGGPRLDVTRVTASATYHRELGSAGIWATTTAWSRNGEPGGPDTNAFLAETNVTLNERHAWFGRFELSEKSGDDLAVDTRDLYTVAKLEGGYTRYFAPWNGLKPGIGAALSAGIVPASLKLWYGNRVNWGSGVFLTLRPAAHAM